MKMLGASFVCGAALACSSPPARPPSPPLPVPPLPSASSGSAEPSVSKTIAPSDPCAPLASNEVSDDETPSLAGASGRIKAGDWLEARGVSKGAFRSWVRAHDPANLEDFDADSLFDNDDSCQTLTVGDKSEAALLCTLAVRTSILRYSAVAFVVRNKRIALVLDVGYALPAMDWPDSRWLDLLFTFSSVRLEADLHDRAAPGTVLVMSPRECHEHFARYLACEKAHRDGAPNQDVCPQQYDPSQQPTFGHLTPTPPASPMGGDRVELLGCAEALPKLDELVKQTKPRDLYAAEFRADRAFAIKSCKARGHYVWKGDRFVPSPTGARPSSSGSSI